MNHEYKDLKQNKEKLRSIIYLHASFNLGLLNNDNHEATRAQHTLYEDLKQIEERLRSNVYFQKSMLNVAKSYLSFLSYIPYLSVRYVLKCMICIKGRTEYIVLDVAKKHILIGCEIASKFSSCCITYSGWSPMILRICVISMRQSRANYAHHIPIQLMVPYHPRTFLYREKSS